MSGSGVDHLMERYAAGDHAAFAPLYDALAPRLLAFLKRSTRDGSLAEDLTQQTFLRMHRARGSFTEGAAVVPWAYAIARRLMFDAQRTRRRKPEDAISHDDMLASADSPEKRTADRERLHHLEVKLKKLPEQHRTAFDLIRVEGLSLAEAAAVVGATPAAMKMRAHRAYVALGLSHEEGSS
ncbi:MAG: RNA polymerase sigma factor [Clostridia bacterium]|nr:RNA polymerase sigma factor [Deltaproteobacteria bacterium]